MAKRQDPTMNNYKLQEVIISGWPSKQSQVPTGIQEYWNYREEQSVANDIILKGEKLVIPLKLREEMLAKIHSCHLGIVKCKQRAKGHTFLAQNV